MNVSEYMELLSKVDPGSNACVGVVWIGPRNEKKSSNMVVCTTDSLPMGMEKIEMNVIADAVLNLITTRKGLREDNMKRFINALQQEYRNRIEREMMCIVEECNDLLNMKID